MLESRFIVQQISLTLCASRTFPSASSEFI
jgi:hypothetical protein